MADGRPSAVVHPRGEAITNPHGCGFPDEACRSCEAATTPPCCFTPYLCGGPHADCRGPFNEALDDILKSDADILDALADNTAPETDDALPAALDSIPDPERRDDVNDVDDVYDCDCCGPTDGGGGSCR